MKNKKIEERIRNRTYASPARARVALGRSLLSAGTKRQLGALIDLWESDHHPIVGGLPPTATDDLTPLLNGAGTIGHFLELDTRVRVHFTLEGMTHVWRARDQVPVPADFVARGGVWEGRLWELAIIIAPAAAEGARPTVDNMIEILEPTNSALALLPPGRERAPLPDFRSVS